MTWLRLEAAYFSNPAMIRAGWDGKIVFLALMTMAKLHNLTHGEFEKDDCDVTVLRAHIGVPESRHSDEQLRAGLQACIRVGLIEETETTYKVRAWSKYQIDPTAKERAKKHREKKKREKASQNATLRNRNHGDIRDVQDVRDGEDENHPPSPAAGGGGDGEQSRMERNVLLTWASIRSERKGPWQQLAHDVLRWAKENSLSSSRVHREYERIETKDPDAFLRSHQRLARASRRAHNGATR